MSLPDKYRYIVIEGPIGAGKTSLAPRAGRGVRRVARAGRPGRQSLPAALLSGCERYALPAQLFFLFQRVNQLRELTSPTSSRLAISDSCWTRTRCSRRSR